MPAFMQLPTNYLFVAAPGSNWLSLGCHSESYWRLNGPTIIFEIFAVGMGTVGW